MKKLFFVLSLLLILFSSCDFNGVLNMGRFFLAYRFYFDIDFTDQNGSISSIKISYDDKSVENIDITEEDMTEDVDNNVTKFSFQKSELVEPENELLILDLIITFTDGSTENKTISYYCYGEFQNESIILQYNNEYILDMDLFCGKSSLFH